MTRTNEQINRAIKELIDYLNKFKDTSIGTFEVITDTTIFDDGCYKAKVSNGMLRIPHEYIDDIIRDSKYLKGIVTEHGNSILDSFEKNENKSI